MERTHHAPSWRCSTASWHIIRDAAIALEKAAEEEEDEKERHDRFQPFFAQADSLRDRFDNIITTLGTPITQVGMKRKANGDPTFSTRVDLDEKYNRGMSDRDMWISKGNKDRIRALHLVRSAQQCFDKAAEHYCLTEQVHHERTKRHRPSRTNL